LPARDDLPRHLGLLDSTAIFVGVILGSGIFVAPSAVAAATGSLGAAAALWIGCGAVAACGALCYAECSARFPRTGGFYVFYREVFGEASAFVGGWAALVVTYPASIAAIAFVFARYLGDLFPEASRASLAALGIALSALANVLGVRAGARAQVLLSAVKIVPLLALVVAALLAGSTAGAAAAAPAAVPSGFVALFPALLVILWTYDGWSDLTLVAGEVRRPERNLARTALLGIGVLAVVYVLVQAAVSLLLPRDAAIGSPGVVADAVAAGLGSEAGRFVSVLVVIATFGAIHGVLLTSSRLGYAMARDGVFPRWFGSLAPRLGTPARSIAFLTVVSLAYLLFLDFEGLLSLFSFSVWIFYGLAGVAVLLLRRRAGDASASAGSAVAPYVVLATAAVVTVSVARQSGARAAWGALILLAGFPIHAAWRRLRARSQA
jgi:APA family basic amino acid/polyamine antiporter